MLEDKIIFINYMRNSKLTDVPTLINLLSNFDIDIYLNFNPDRCLFREQFLRLEEKKEVNEIEKKGNEMAFDEDAMLGQVLVKEEEMHMLKQKEKEYVLEVKARSKNQKDVSPEEIRIMFMMHGVLIDTFIKAVKIDTITKSSFIGTLVRLSDNINRHLLSEGGFFSLVINLKNGKHAVFYFDEPESLFKCNYYDSPLLEMIADSKTAYNKQHVIKDLMECRTANDCKVALDCYKTLLDMSKENKNNTFKYSKPDSSIWLLHFLKIKNESFREHDKDNQIRSITFLSVHQMYTVRDQTSAQKSLAKDSASMVVPIAKSLKRASGNNLSANSHNIISDTILKELQNIKPQAKSFEDVYKQVAVFLNYFTNFTDFIQLLNERSTLSSFNDRLFEKLTDAFNCMPKDK